MFTPIRLKLTGLYLVIIMLISALFSIAVYRNLTEELERGLRMQARRYIVNEQQLDRWLEDAGSDYNSANNSFIPPPFDKNLPIGFDLYLFKEAKNRILIRLVFVNIWILVVSGLAGYFLAGRTLKPIENMIEKQKQFIIDASHELRTPLTALKTEIEVALREKKLSIRDAKKLLKSNLEEVEKMRSLSNYLLMLSRYQDTNHILTYELVSLSDIINDVYNNLEHKANEKQIIINKEIIDQQISTNKISLIELLTIILDNAIKYSPEGSSILMATKISRSHAEISIIDKGIGIKASDLSHIFQRFYRADTSRCNSDTEGYGLGLSIAKNIADQLSAIISVRSKENIGTEFTVKIPMKRVKKV